ncbi:TonB-dependent receptor [Chitinophaga pinensis]|nr:TonB-dependent receptor [Chitinophaga pinensis]
MMSACKKTASLLLLSVLIHLQVSAQLQIRGTVKEDSTQLPIAYAKITVLNLPDSTIVANAESDAAGGYEIRHLKKGNYALKAVLIGYREVSVPLNLTTTDNNIAEQSLVLKRDPRLLKEVTVASRKPLIEYKIDKIVLNVEKSILTNGNSVWNLLGKSPGVETSGSAVSILGTTGAVVLINGKSTYLRGEQLSNMLRGMAADQVSQIEIIKHPSARYEAGQGVGVVNIRTVRNQAEGMNGTASFTYGQGKYDKYSPAVNLNYKVGKLNAYANYSFMSIKDYQRQPSYVNYADQTVPVYFDQQQYARTINRSHTLIGGLDYTINAKHTIGFQVNAQRVRRKSQYDNDTYIWSKGNIDSIVHTNSAIRYPSGVQLYNVYYNLTMGAKGSLSVNADYAHYNADNGQDYFFSYFNPNMEERKPSAYFRNEAPVKLNVKGITVDFIRKLKNDYTLELGAKSTWMENNSDLVYAELEGDKYRVDTAQLNKFDYTENVNAAYFNLEKAFKKWTVKAGTRVEQTIAKGSVLRQNDIVDRNYFRVFPSVFAQYVVNKNHEFNFSYTTSFERPNYNYLSPLAIRRDPNAYSTGNPFLKPSYTNTLELAYIFRKKYRVAIEIDNISDRIEQSVQQHYDTQSLQNIIANIDHCYYYRIYFIIPVTITKWWQSNITWNNYLIQYKTPYLNGTYNITKPVFYINANNTFPISKSVTAEMTAYYRTPSLNGLYEVGTRFFVDAAIRKTFSAKFAAVLSVTDIFYTNRWQWDINYLDQHSGYKTYTDSRVVKLNLSYKFGNSKLRTAKRHTIGIGSERDRMR